MEGTPDPPATRADLRRARHRSRRLAPVRRFRSGRSSAADAAPPSRAARRAAVAARRRNGRRRSLAGVLATCVLVAVAVGATATGLLPTGAGGHDLVQTARDTGPTPRAGRAAADPPTRTPSPAGATADPATADGEQARETTADLCVDLVRGRLEKDTAAYVRLVAATNGSDLEAWCADRVGDVSAESATTP